MSGWGLVPRKTKWLKGWGFDPATPPGGAEGLEMEFSCTAGNLISRVCVMKLQSSLLTPRLGGASQPVGTLMCQEGYLWGFPGEKSQKLCAPSLTVPPPPHELSVLISYHLT